MTIFMDLVLQTPPSWLSMPSKVPLEVATAEKRERGARLGLTVTVKKKKGCVVLSWKNSQFPKTTEERKLSTEEKTQTLL